MIVILNLKQKVISLLWGPLYLMTIWMVFPLNLLFCVVFARRFAVNSVLHVSYPVHVAWDTVSLIRGTGAKADFLAIGENPFWDRYDYKLERLSWPFMSAIRDVSFFWRVMSRYAVIHSHFMITLSAYQWELPLLKLMGRRFIAHFRGCEGRVRERNIALHPDVNICQDCDYGAVPCSNPEAVRKRRAAKRYADTIIVTTRDMKDFWPNAEQLPFFVPPGLGVEMQFPPSPANDEFTIVHATNHPGIEGTAFIEGAIQSLKKKGRTIRFISLSGVAHDKVLEEFSRADLAIGKMKMGDYANAQVESMALGVPTVTGLRKEFVTSELKESGFIFSTLENIEATIEELLDNPKLLASKRVIARQSILRLHDNDDLLSRLFTFYGWSPPDLSKKVDFDIPEGNENTCAAF